MPANTAITGQSLYLPPNYTQWRGNDSGGYGTPIGLTKVMFQLFQVGATAPTNFQFTVYGTIDPNAYLCYTYDGVSDPLNPSFTGQQGAAGSPVGGVAFSLPASSWSPIPAPSVEGGSPDSFAFSNPITPSNPLYFCAYPFVAYRVVLTSATSTTGACVVVGFGVP